MTIDEIVTFLYHSRIEHEQDQDWLANELDVPVEVVRQWEANKMPNHACPGVTASHLARWCALFGVELTLQTVAERPRKKPAPRKAPNRSMTGPPRGPAEVLLGWKLP